MSCLSDCNALDQIEKIRSMRMGDKKGSFGLIWLDLEASVRDLGDLASLAIVVANSAPFLVDPDRAIRISVEVFNKNRKGLCVSHVVFSSSWQHCHWEAEPVSLRVALSHHAVALMSL